MESDTYTLNRGNLPVSPVAPEEHRRFLNMAIIVTILAIILGLAFWWYSSTQTQDTVIPMISDAQINAEITDILRQTSVQEVSAEEVNRIATELRKSKTTVTVEERVDIANSLRGINIPADN